MTDKVIIISTPFIPCGWAGTVKVQPTSLDMVREFISRAEVVESYCGHPQTAEYLGVACNRGMIEKLEADVLYVGIRPLRRMAVGEEIAITEADFEGFTMAVVSSD